jgi:hypothetical protein
MTDRCGALEGTEPQSHDSQQANRIRVFPTFYYTFPIDLDRIYERPNTMRGGR